MCQTSVKQAQIKMTIGKVYYGNGKGETVTLPACTPRQLAKAGS